MQPPKPIASMIVASFAAFIGVFNANAEGGYTVSEHGVMCDTIDQLVTFYQYAAENNMLGMLKLTNHGCRPLKAGDPLRIVSKDAQMARVEFGGWFGYMALSGINDSTGTPLAELK